MLIIVVLDSTDGKRPPYVIYNGVGNLSCLSENMTLRVGSSAMPLASVEANILQAVPQAIAALSGGWGSVQSLHVKTPYSAALPLYSCMPGDAAAIALLPPSAAGGSAAGEWTTTRLLLFLQPSLVQ